MGGVWKTGRWVRVGDSWVDGWESRRETGKWKSTEGADWSGDGQVGERGGRWMVGWRSRQKGN
jgi:hypothetical protein